MHNLSKTQVVLSWVLQLAAAGILLQTLFFKFTGAEESVYIFTTLGIEPWGRIGSGIAGVDRRPSCCSCRPLRRWARSWR